MIRCYHTCDVIIKFFFAKSFTFRKTTQTTFAIVKFLKLFYNLGAKRSEFLLNLSTKAIAEIEPSIFYAFRFNSMTIATRCGQVATALRKKLTHAQY